MKNETSRKCACCGKRVSFPLDFCSKLCAREYEIEYRKTEEHFMGEAEIAAKCQ